MSRSPAVVLEVVVVDDDDVDYCGTAVAAVAVDVPANYVLSSPAGPFIPLFQDPKDLIFRALGPG